jgi:MYXO-CTERM domain-containing protein
VKRAVFALVLTAVSAASVPALANGRFPAANQLVVTPGKPDALVLRTTFGVLFSNDGGKGWDWVCERAVGYGGTWDPPIGVFQNGTVAAGTTDGLALSTDHGCGWSFAKGTLDKHVFIDLAVRSDAPNEALLLTSTSVGSNDAGAPIFRTAVFATPDAAATATALASADFDPSFIAQTIDAAKSDRNRIYVSGSVGADGALYTSENGGTSFTAHAIELVKPDERAPFIAAVSPTDANRVYVRTGGRSSRLLVTDDGGKTFKNVFSGGPLTGFALSPDGMRLWIGSAEGLYAATSHDLAFSKIADTPINCLTATDSTLYACVSDPHVPFVLGASSDGGKTFAPVLTLQGVRGPLACASSTSAATCAADWPALHATLDPTLGSSTDAGAAATTAPLVGGGGCASATTSASARSVAFLGALLFAVAAGLRRRRQRR